MLPDLINQRHRRIRNILYKTILINHHYWQEMFQNKRLITELEYVVKDVIRWTLDDCGFL